MSLLEGHYCHARGFFEEDVTFNDDDDKCTACGDSRDHIAAQVIANAN